MRYLKPSLVGLLGGLLLTAALLAVEMVRADRVMASQMAKCEAASDPTAGGGICSGYADAGGRELPVAFALGFAAAFVWFLRRQQRLAPWLVSTARSTEGWPDLMVG